MRRSLTVAVSAMVALSVVPAFPVAAEAATSWLGACYTWHDNRTAGGWCDGNGPYYTYSTTASCTNGGLAYGPNRWAGDRRESYAYCSSIGQYLTGGVLDAFHNGLLVEQITIPG
jgi:hypothetical protein